MLCRYATRQLLAVVLHARHCGEQHLVRDLSEELRRQRHHRVRAPVETECVGAERAADDEVVALHRDPVADPAEEVPAAVRHEVAHRLAGEARPPRVGDDEPQQRRVHDGRADLAVDERPHAPSPRREHDREHRVARVAGQLDHRERAELHAAGQQEVADGQAPDHERQPAHDDQRCERGQPEERGNHGRAERDTHPDRDRQQRGEGEQRSGCARR